jgi:hypothetical protein
MRRTPHVTGRLAAVLLSAAGAACLVGVPPSLAAAAPAAAPAPVPVTAPVAGPVSVELDQTTRSIRIGERFSFASTVRNTGDQSLSGLVAHLNVLGLDPDIYVDPEDWSTRRTLYLDPLPAGGSTPLRWDVQAVSAGRVVLYVTVTAKEGFGKDADQVVASGPLRVAVAQQRMLNAGGVLPLALAMPAIVLLLMGFAIRRQRRLR